MRVVLVVLIAGILALQYSQRIEPLAPSADMPTFNETRARLGAEPYRPAPPPPSPRYEAQAGCPFPGIADGVDLMLVSSQGGQGISSTTLHAQENAITAAQMIVEDGDTELYIVAVTHEPVIWQVSGATQRVRHLVLSSRATPQPRGTRPSPLVGATGLPAERVTVAANRNCLPSFTSSPSAGATETAEVLRQYVGRKPSVTAADEHIWSVSLPSGAITRTHDAFISWSTVPAVVLQWLGWQTDLPMGVPLLKNQLGQYRPGGVVQIDPATVVSAHTAAPYRVLPQEAGLVQLAEEDALRFEKMGRLVVTRPIQLPGGLYGAHSRTFILEDGVPMPTGDPGHSCIMSREGKVLTDSC